MSLPYLIKQNKPRGFFVICDVNSHETIEGKLCLKNDTAFYASAYPNSSEKVLRTTYIWFPSVFLLNLI